MTAIRIKPQFVAFDSERIAIVEGDVTEEPTMKLDGKSVVVCHKRAYLTESCGCDSDVIDSEDFVPDSWENIGYAVFSKDGFVFYPRDKTTHPYPVPPEGSVVFDMASHETITVGSGGLYLKKKNAPVDEGLLPLAVESTEWDGDAARKALLEFSTINNAVDWEKYGRGFFWSGEDKEKPDSYKLPFATIIEGVMVAVPAGIMAAAAAVRGARGGVDIPEADLPTVIEAIKAYYGAMEKDHPFVDLSASETVVMVTEVIEMLNELSKMDLPEEALTAIAKIREVMSSATSSLKATGVSMPNIVPTGEVPPGYHSLPDAADSIHSELAKEKVEAIRKVIAELLVTLEKGTDLSEMNHIANRLSDMIWNLGNWKEISEILETAADVRAAVDKVKSAAARLNASADALPKTRMVDVGRMRSFSDRGIFGDLKTNEDGSLTIDCTTFMPMVQEYVIDDEVVKILKHPDEIIKAVKFGDGYVTNDHPSLGFVDSPEMINGFAKNPRLNEKGGMDHTLQIWDTTLIDAIKKGKREVSGGFLASLDFTPGEWEGQPYDAIQRGILVDHVAIVDLGRCGKKDGCGLRVIDVCGGDISKNAARVNESDTKKITLLEDQVASLTNDLKLPIVKQILSISKKKSEGELMRLDKSELGSLLDMLRESKVADDDLKSTKTIKSIQHEKDAAYRTVK